MLYAGIDIHKRVFQAVVLDPETGELSIAAPPVPVSRPGASLLPGASLSVHARARISQATG